MHRLEELKKSSMPAIRHVELVELARTHTPNQARSLADSANWPGRQVRAVRSLAIIRRDFGAEVFNDFIATMEHARSNETEPVQDNRSNQVSDTVARNLGRIEDPVARLRLALKKDLFDIVESSLNELFAHPDTSVELRPRVRGEKEVLFAPSTGEEDMCSDKGLILWIESASNSRRVTVIDFEGMADYLKWSDEQKVDFISEVLEKMAASDPVSMFGRRTRVQAAREACGQYLQDNTSLAKAVELWLLRAQFAEAEDIFRLRQKALPVPQKSAEDPARELDPIVDRFLELGWTNDQVKEEFLLRAKSWIKMGLITPYFLPVVGAKCFSVEDYDDGEIGRLVREDLRPRVWNDLVRYKGPSGSEQYLSFLPYGLKDKDREADREFYREQLIDLLSEGKLITVWHILLAIGGRVLFYAEMQSSIFERAERYLNEIAPTAFDKAFAEQRYGIANAILLQFDRKLFLKVDEEAIRAEVYAEMQVALEPYADVIQLYNSGEDMDEREDQVDAFHQIEQDFREKIQSRVDDAVSARVVKMDEVAEIANDFDQPSKFVDLLNYIAVPNWPKF